MIFAAMVVSDYKIAYLEQVSFMQVVVGQVLTMLLQVVLVVLVVAVVAALLRPLGALEGLVVQQMGGTAVQVAVPAVELVEPTLEGVGVQVVAALQVTLVLAVQV